VRELTGMIDGAVDGMLEMTQELLDYARGYTALQRDRVSIWRLLDDLSQGALRLLPGKNIHFVKHIRYEGDIELDLPRFSRMMGNLIKNASEAMAGGGILTLTTDLVQGQVVIRLSDTGCGIPAEIMPKLFEPFVTHGKSHGTGLGMAIAKSIVEAHQGRVSVASVPGNGTTVDIRIPAPANS
jgi:signal transduction histidine kinase